MAGGGSGHRDVGEPALRALVQLGSLSPPLLSDYERGPQWTRSLWDVGKEEKRKNNTHNSVATSAPAPGAVLLFARLCLPQGLCTGPSPTHTAACGLWDLGRPHALQLSLHSPQPVPLVGCGLIVFSVCSHSRSQLAGFFPYLPACLPQAGVYALGEKFRHKGGWCSGTASHVETGSHHPTGHSEP